MKGLVQWEAFNAYADGELDADRAAAVEADTAADSHAKSVLASIHTLKSAVAATAEPVPEFNLSPGRRRQRMSWAIAAGLAITIGVGAAVVPELRRAEPAWLAKAWEVHDSLPAAPRTPPPAGAVLIGLSYIGPGAHLPDLSAAGLQIGHLGVTP